MSKALEVLERIKENYLWLSKYAYGEQEELDEKDNEMFGTIETALKDCEDIKDICKHYSIEFSLSNIREALFTFAQLKGEYGTNWDNYNKKLKALEIIKEKRVNVLMFVCYANSGKNGFKMYNQAMENEKWQLTQEEFNLLKEVLL